MEFNVFKAIKYPSKIDSYLRIVIIDMLVEETIKKKYMEEPLEACIVHAKSIKAKNDKIIEHARYLKVAPPFHYRKPKFEN